ncbi:FliM/FliN family flagellar motor switch protein [Legionella sp. CNM-4043-24]|uniref:FliM/FliN family flagellar motor switch protein n=1 Tax=Legionella sp. CNM-4043-24 TaxID=3421646 RepID=UPI00403ACECA
MTITVKKIALAEQPDRRADNLACENSLGLIGSVPVNCMVRIGTLSLTVAALRQLKLGQTLSLEQSSSEPVEILLNDQVIAHGDLMTCDDRFAIQITGLCS